MRFLWWNITLAKKERKRTTGYRARAWNAQDTQFILDQNNDGKTAKEISKMLRDRTPAAIASRLNKVRKR